MANIRTADRIRDYAKRNYVEPARRRGESSIKIVAGDIHKGLGLISRVPLVCNALGSKKFLNENGLVLDGRQGPPSGQSSTVTFTYRLMDAKAEARDRPKTPSFLEFRGIAKGGF